MKYIRNYDNFKENQVNEELFGGIIDYFKNMWSKAIGELKKLGDDPAIDKVSEWVDDNPFNPSSKFYLFKTIMENFSKEAEPNNEDCLKLIDSILDPETGALGKEGLQPMYDNLLKAFGKDTATLEIVKYSIEKIRNRAIKDYKYAGGPDLKIGDPDAKVDPNAKKMDLTDSSHLPEFKKVLQDAGEDSKKRKESVINWVNKTLLVRLDKYASEINPDEVENYLKSKNMEAPEGGGEEDGVEAMTYEKLKEYFDKKVPVIYKLKDFDQKMWDGFSDDEKKNTGEEPASKIVGVKKIESLNDQDKEDSVVFLDKDGQPNIKKAYSDIIGPASGDESDEKAKAAEALGKIKDDPEKMTKVSKYAEFLQDEANKDKLTEIETIINGE